MRVLIASLALIAAAPAAAQDTSSALLNAQALQMQADQQLARMRDVATTNEMMVLEFRLQTDEALRRLEASRAPEILPTLPYPSAGLGVAAPADLSKLPSVPEAALADSNRRVQEIPKNSR